LALGTVEAEKMLCSLDPRFISLPDGALTVEAKDDQATIHALQKVMLDLVVIPREALRTLHDGVIIELWALEQRELNIISEQKVNNSQIFSKNTSTIELFKAIMMNNEHTTMVVTEACSFVPELDIQEDAPMDEWIQKLVVGVHKSRSKLSKVQLELNINITEFALRDQPSTPLKLKEQCEVAIKDIIATVDSAVKKCTMLFK